MDVTTARPVDLRQLAEQVGAPLSMTDDGTTRTIFCLDDTVTKAALQAAVDEHVPEPEPPSAYDRLQDQFNEFMDFLIDIGVI